MGHQTHTHWKTSTWNASRLPISVYHAAVESNTLLTSVVYRLLCRRQNRFLQGAVRTPEKKSLAASCHPWRKSPTLTTSKEHNGFRDCPQPVHHLFELLPSGRYRSAKTHTCRFTDFFFLRAISVPNT